MSITFEDTEVDPDISIPEVENVEYPCQVCGREAGPYAGRGRKPKFCADHKPSKNVTTSKPRLSGKNGATAIQAAEILAQYNGLVALVATLAHYEYTGEAIRNVNDTFKEQATAALLADPELANQIVRAGGVSGKAALIMAYGMMVAAVAPVGMLEFKQNRAAKAEGQE